MLCLSVTGADALGTPSFIHLTPRERSLLPGIRDGSSNSAIAKRLGIKMATVKMYLSRLYLRFRVKNRAEFSAAVQRQDDGLALAAFVAPLPYRERGVMPVNAVHGMVLWDAINRLLR